MSDVLDWQRFTGELGADRSVLADTLAGADINYTFPNAARLIAFRGVLSTAAGGGARSVRLVLLDASGHAVTETQAPATQAASTFIIYEWFAGAPYVLQAISGLTPVAMMPFPPNLVVSAGWRFTSLTTSIGASDGWNTLSLTLG